VIRQRLFVVAVVVVAAAASVPVERLYVVGLMVVVDPFW
jgi:hypothetical protein